MEKIVRNGEVAVAVSFGFGAGWSTWNQVEPKVDPTDARYNSLFLEGKNKEAAAMLEAEGGYAGGADDVEIVWVPEGTKFVITEYDGSENLMCVEDFDWYTA